MQIVLYLILNDTFSLRISNDVRLISVFYNENVSELITWEVFSFFICFQLKNPNRKKQNETRSQITFLFLFK